MKFPPSQQRRYVFFFSCALVFVIILSIGGVFGLGIHRDERLWPLAEFFLRVLVALMASGIAACLPGFLDIDWSKRLGLRAAGSFAIFVLVFLVNPPKLMAELDDARSVVALHDYCKDNISFDRVVAADVRVRCRNAVRSFPEHWRAHLTLARLHLVDGDREAVPRLVDAIWLLRRDGGGSVGMEEAAYSVNEVIHSLRNAANIFPSYDWAWGLEKDIRTRLGLVDPSGAYTDRTYDLFDSVYLRANMASRLREDLSSALEDSAALLEAVPENSPGRLRAAIYALCLESWHDLMHVDQIRHDRYREGLRKIQEIALSTAGQLATKQRFECFLSDSECQEYPLAITWCPAFSWGRG